MGENKGTDVAEAVLAIPKLGVVATEIRVSAKTGEEKVKTNMGGYEISDGNG